MHSQFFFIIKCLHFQIYPCLGVYWICSNKLCEVLLNAKYLTIWYCGFLDPLTLDCPRHVGVFLYCCQIFWRVPLLISFPQLWFLLAWVGIGFFSVSSLCRLGEVSSLWGDKLWMGERGGSSPDILRAVMDWRHLSIWQAHHETHRHVARIPWKKWAGKICFATELLDTTGVPQNETGQWHAFCRTSRANDARLATCRAMTRAYRNKSAIDAALQLYFRENDRRSVKT